MDTMDSMRTLSDKTFWKISRFIYDGLGIKMPPAKKTMLQGRLLKRMRQLNMDTFEDYYDYLCGQEGRRFEMIHMFDAVTTNKTDFFREPKHFEYLTEKVLSERIHLSGTGLRKPLIVWSAGCSTGAEPYTLAMVLSEFAQSHQGFDYFVFATDISTQVLTKAHKAIYTEDEVGPIPLPLKKKYLLRSKDRSQALVRITPAIRKKIQFTRLNFMDEHYPITTNVDVIFCRNVLIYFDHQTQQQVLTRLCRRLQPDGYLFTGHSETLNGFELPLYQVATTVYRKYNT